MDAGRLLGFNSGVEVPLLSPGFNTLDLSADETWRRTLFFVVPEEGFES